MTDTEIIKEAIRLLEMGHVQQADLELRRTLEYTELTSPYYKIMHHAAQLIHPLDKPQDALQVLKDYMEHLEGQ